MCMCIEALPLSASFSIVSSLSDTAFGHFADLSTEFANCTLGDVRLTNFTDDSEEESRQGILQICINNAWGTVCSDNYFDNTDTEVFCNTLVGFNATG